MRAHIHRNAILSDLIQLLLVTQNAWRCLGSIIAARVITCPPGQFAAHNEQIDCTPCKAGTYSMDYDSTSVCFSCMRGAFAERNGSTSCQLSAAGSFVRGTGQTASALCSTGTFQFMGGSSACIQCAPGHFQTASGSTACSACLPGYHQRSKGATRCSQCEKGRFSWEEGSMACLFCEPGSFQSVAASTGCSKCEPGYSQAKHGQDRCVMCPPGQFQPGSGSLRCLECPEGAYQEQEGSTGCVDCRAGTYQSRKGASHRQNCTVCPEGTYGNGTGMTTACIRCMPGTYASAAGLTECMRCDAGTFQESHAASTCQACPRGTAGKDNGLSSQIIGCVPCPRGSFGAEPGLTACQACHPGALQPSPHASACLDCIPGTFIAESGWSEAECYGCKAGTFSSRSGASDESVCETCRPGHFSTMQGARDARACTVCPRGTTSTESRSRCADCEPHGTFCPEGSDTPIECGKRDEEKLVCNGSHLSAVPGFLAVLRLPNCTGAIPCPPGTECHAHPLEGDGIMEGAVGQTHIVVFEDGPNSTQLSCEDQPPMTYGYSRVDWPEYSDRTRGHKILFRLRPEGCLAGSFLKNSICEPCPPGTFLNHKGALDVSECLVCLQGKYAVSNGSTLCRDCSQGSYRTLDATENTCLTCNPGAFQAKTGQSSCIRCRAGTFVSTTGASACQACPAGTAQAAPGSVGCQACDPMVQFSSIGDSQCSQCWSTPGPETHKLACQNDVGTLPERVDAVWITTTGKDGSDACVGRGETEKKLSYTGLHEQVAVLGHSSDLECKHTMRFMGRPELTRTWNTAPPRTQPLQRPVLLEVVPHNDTFYPALCAKHGLSVAFHVKDAGGNSITNLTESEAVLSYVDPLSGDLLFWTACNQLPQTVQTGRVVALGYCHTRSFCPVTDVEARVTLSWPGGSSVQGRRALRVGKWMPCPPSSSWLTYVELVEPGIPFFTGDVMHVRIRTVEAPTRIVGFKFQIRLSIGAEFLGLSSVYAVSHTLEDHRVILSVQGENTDATAHDVLCELKIRQSAKEITGLHGILQAIPHSFQLRTEDHVSYQALIRTQGFACGDEQGVLVALLETPRITSVVAELSRKKLVYWKALQDSARLFEARVETVGIWNTQISGSDIRMASLIVVAAAAQCSSLDPDFVGVKSCSQIQAQSARGLGGAGRIRVRINAMIMTTVSVQVLVPVSPSVRTFVSLDGMSGRFKVLARLLSGGTGDEFGHVVDATPFIMMPVSSMMAMSFPQSAVVRVDGEEWRCVGPPAENFTVGQQPVLFRGTCSEQKYKKGLIPFLFTGGYGGVHGFVFDRSVIHPKTPEGTLLLFSSDNGLLWSRDDDLLGTNRESLRVLDSSLETRRISIAENERVSLLSHAMSPRCIPLLYPGLPHQTISIAVFPAAPASLHVILSTYVLVTQHDVGDVLPARADIIEAWLTLSDDEKYDLLGNEGLVMHTSDDLDIIPAVGIKSRTTGGVFGITFRMEGVHCLSYFTTVRVHPYSITSAVLECPRCPAVLTMEDDPLSSLLPLQFLTSIPIEWFVLRCILVDGSKRDKLQVQLTVEGAAQVRGERIVGLSQGVLRISTPLARTAFQMQVIQRWALDLELLCNGVGCVDPGVSLTPPGNGASLPPFGYSTNLIVSAKFVLANRTTFVSPIPPGMALYANSQRVDPSAVPLLGYELVELSLFIPQAWQIASTAVSIWVHVLQSMRIDGPRMLYQVHCSGMWERGSYRVTGKLSDGVESELLRPLFTVDDGEPHHTNAFSPESAGQGVINVTHGTFVEQFLVIATVSSKYVRSVRLDFMPSSWNAPLQTPLSLEPVLEPAFDVTSPGQLWETVLTWDASEDGIVEWGRGSVSLLSDYYQPIVLTSVLAGCNDVPEQRFSKRVDVNVVPNRRGQVDLGAENGPPLPWIAVGEVLSIPVYLFVDSKLYSYSIRAYFEKMALLPTLCTAGDFPGGVCELTEGRRQSFLLTGEFHESQRAGRILVGTIHGRAMLDTLSHVQVDVEDLLVDPAAAGYQAADYTPPTVFRFAVRTGNARLIIAPHQRYLTEVNPASQMMSEPHALFLDEDPSSLLVCCNTTVMKKDVRLGRVLPHMFALARVQVSWDGDHVSHNIDVMDPRLQLEFDRTLMEFTPAGPRSASSSWTILDTGGDWGPESMSAIRVVYTHPGTLGQLSALIFVTLAQVEDIVLEPEIQEVRRIHCSPSLFQSKCATPIVVLRNGLGRIQLMAGDSLSTRSEVASVLTVHIIGEGPQQVCVNAVAVGSSGVTVSLSDRFSKTFQVAVLDASITISRLFLPDPVYISSYRGGFATLPVSGYTQDDEAIVVVPNLQPFGATVSNAPVRLVKTYPSSLDVSVLESTEWAQAETDTLTVSLPACENQPASSVTSRLRVSVTPRMHRLADVTTRAFEDRIQLSLVGPDIASFFVHLRVVVEEDQAVVVAGGPSYQCATAVAQAIQADHDHFLTDCAVLVASPPSHVDILIAGNRSVVDSKPATNTITAGLATLWPRPTHAMWGFVEVFSAGQVTRLPVDAGRIGTPTTVDPIRALMPDLPVMDAAGLQRRSGSSSTLPALHGADPLFLMTGRHRLVDMETYSNDHELSIMFRVTDRFLVPDTDSCKITCTVEDSTGAFPLLPGAVRQTNGDQIVTAVQVKDGWYAIQTDGLTVIPAGPDILRLKTIRVETSSSYQPWELILDEQDRRLPHLGRELHACPRMATDNARFSIAFRVTPPIPVPPSPDLLNALTCALHVVARRISIKEEGGPTATTTLSVFVESFVRLRQVREIVLNPSFANLLHAYSTGTTMDANESLLSSSSSSPRRVLEIKRILYVDDKSDANISCPPGTFFSRNGTYQKLPEHAQAGIDCYGMVCVNGYEAVSNLENGWTACIPMQVSQDVLWVCVTIILSLLAFVVCIICCVKLSRSSFPPRSSDEPLPAPLSGILSPEDASVYPAYEDSRRWGSSVTEVILDDHSLMMLEGEFSPVPSGRDESRRYQTTS